MDYYSSLIVVGDEDGSFSLECFTLLFILSHFFQVAKSKRLESVVACQVSMAPIGRKTKVEIHIPIGPVALSRTDFSLIMPMT